MNFEKYHEFYESAQLTESERTQLTQSMRSEAHCDYAELYKETPKWLFLHACDWSDRIEDWTRARFGLHLEFRGDAIHKIARVTQDHFQKVQTLFNCPDVYSGLFYPLTCELLVSPDLSDEEQKNVLRHELVHSYAYKMSRVRRLEDGFCIPELRRNGYSAFTNRGLKSFFFLDEVITELLHIEIWQDACDQEGNNDHRFLLAYLPYLFVFESLIETCANNLGMTVESLMHYLYLGYFNGSTVSLRLLHLGISKKTLQYIAHMPEHQVFLKELLPALEGDVCAKTIEEKVARYRSGEGVMLFGREVQLVT